MCSCDSGDPPYVYRSDILTARKAHRCYECPRRILPGQRYERVTAMWERGDWQTIETCLKCWAIRQAFRDVHDGCFLLHGNMRDEFLECVQELRRPPPDARDEGYLPPLDPLLLEFGVRLRAHLGKYGPQQRRAA